jgi:hypothetical protein
MLVIRDQQMQAFAQNAKRQFEAETVRHISEFAPRQFEILGEKTIRQIVSLGVERAEKYGFTNRGPVRFYTELMFMFGSDFDTDLQYAWAAELLNGTDPADQMSRADQLHQSTMRYIEMVAGQGLEYEREALNRIVPSPVALTFSGDDTKGIAEFFNKIYPQKCEYLGDSVLEELVQRGISSSAAYSESSRAAMIFAGLMFIFGHGCLSDPQFPWIANTLEKDVPGDAESKIEQLYSKTRIYLENALKRLEGRAQYAPEWL